MPGESCVYNNRSSSLTVMGSKTIGGDGLHHSSAQNAMHCRGKKGRDLIRCSRVLRVKTNQSSHKPPFSMDHVVPYSYGRKRLGFRADMPPFWWCRQQPWDETENQETRTLTPKRRYRTRNSGHHTCMVYYTKRYCTAGGSMRGNIKSLVALHTTTASSL